MPCSLTYSELLHSSHVQGIKIFCLSLSFPLCSSILFLLFNIPKTLRVNFFVLSWFKHHFLSFISTNLQSLLNLNRVMLLIELSVILIGRFIESRQCLLTEFDHMESEKDKKFAVFFQLLERRNDDFLFRIVKFIVLFILNQISRFG